MKTININFYQLLSKTNADNEAPIYYKISGKGDRPIKKSTGFFLTPELWDKDKQMVKHKHPNAFQINSKLSKIREDLQSLYFTLEKENSEVSVFDVQQQFEKDKIKSVKLIETYQAFIDEITQRLGSEYSEGTIRHHRSTRNFLIEFIKSKYKTQDIKLSNLQYDFIIDFEIFLQKTYGNKLNTIDRKTSRLKAVVNFAIRNKYLSINPFLGHEAKTEPTTRKYLSQQELKKIEKASLHGIRSDIRDLFLFMCYTGLSYQDLFTLSKCDFIHGENGNEYIRKQRGKTKAESLIPVYNKAKMIISKFQQREDSKIRNTVFPYYSNKTMNDNIRAIGKSTLIDKSISCHVARHTLATLALENRVPMETVSKVLGHTSIKTTQRYGKITQIKIERDFTDALKFLS